MSKPSKAQQIRDLEKEVRKHNAARHQLMVKIEEERLSRIAAQKGLVPYVRSLQQFDQWLKRRPNLRKRLQPILQELGLWQIKLAYDPDKDLSLTVASPQRYADLQEALRTLNEDPRVRHGS